MLGTDSEVKTKDVAKMLKDNVSRAGEMVRKNTRSGF